MISNVITYLIIGVLFNFVFDKLVDVNESEDLRFTIGERITMTLIWPVGVGMFVIQFLKEFFSKK
jgi:hypothetical protein